MLLSTSEPAVLSGSDFAPNNTESTGQGLVVDSGAVSSVQMLATGQGHQSENRCKRPRNANSPMILDSSNQEVKGCHAVNQVQQARQTHLEFSSINGELVHRSCQENQEDWTASFPAVAPRSGSCDSNSSCCSQVSIQSSDSVKELKALLNKHAHRPDDDGRSCVRWRDQLDPILEDDLSSPFV